MSSTTRPLEIGVGGMTCAACVRRVENGLRKLPSVVDASVNLATERARVQFNHPPSSTDEQAIRDAIIKLGYEAIDLNTTKILEADNRREAETNQLWRLFVGSACFTTPLVVLAMAPMLSASIMNAMMRVAPMEQWNWVMLGLTASL